MQVQQMQHDQILRVVKLDYKLCAGKPQILELAISSSMAKNIKIVVGIVTLNNLKFLATG